jgi:predicted metalloprotease with PDZ domain
VIRPALALRAGFLLILAVCLVPPQASATIQYRISLEHPEKHVFAVEMRIPGVTGGVTVQLPAWNALYMVRDFSSHLRQVSAHADGKIAPVEKLDKQTWRISGSGTITIRYETYWDEPGPFATQLNSEHAFINTAMILLYVPERRGEDVRLELRQIPSGWRATSALLPTTGAGKEAAAAAMSAANYDALADAPMEAGRFEEFTLPGVTPPVRVVIHSENWDRAQLTESLRRICNYEMELMRDRPFAEYTFLLHIGKAAGGAGGGMEHANSTAISVSDMDYVNGVSAHEFFHLWNVKRIRPASLEPVDYTREQYSRALWFAEGVTSTYSAYTQVRSGLWSKEQFYADLAGQIGELEGRPANAWQSAEESSLDAWLEKYSLYNEGDKSVSYYTKGQVLGLLLDISIRDRTGNAESLDDVLRRMNEEFARKGRTYQDSADVRRMAESVAGGSFEEFFRRYVAAAEPLPYRKILGLAGLELRQEESLRASLGFQLARDSAAGYRVSGSVSDAAVAAGLRPGDMILEWDGGQVPRRMEHWLRSRKPGEKLRLRLRREDAELSIEFPLGEEREMAWQVKEAHGAGEKAKRIRDGLLHGWTQPGVAGAATPR